MAGLFVGVLDSKFVINASLYLELCFTDHDELLCRVRRVKQHKVALLYHVGYLGRKSSVGVCGCHGSDQQKSCS
jgi:hypothetical protein